ncbi:hypothetical protein EC604_28950 [Paenibacillus amylolyticus]|uniref:Uncharacterized protein n=1 Tax=Paenibacillus amylolyticus TaxID=1451 RepID=A0A5M9X1Y3_PAEAM|nr:hypothetical protein [Paenibacillus amylolyticus]KAA8787855.1 hypothetical protein EC604_28950 [Paenibacillus amylolyticus]
MDDFVVTKDMRKIWHDVKQAIAEMKSARSELEENSKAYAACTTMIEKLELKEREYKVMVSCRIRKTIRDTIQEYQKEDTRPVLRLVK